MHARASFFHSEVSIDQGWMNGDKIFRSHEHVQCSSKLMTKSESWLGLGPIDAPGKAVVRTVGQKIGRLMTIIIICKERKA